MIDPKLFATSTTEPIKLRLFRPRHGSTGYRLCPIPFTRFYASGAGLRAAVDARWLVGPMPLDTRMRQIMARRGGAV